MTTSHRQLPLTGKPPELRPFVIAAVAVATAMLLRYLLSPVLGREVPLLLFVAAVVTAAWYGGLWPGLFATVLASVAGNFFLTEPIGFDVDDAGDVVRVVLFALIGFAVSVVAEVKRRSDLSIIESRERLRITLASVGDAVVTTDIEGRVTSLNPVAELLTGWNIDDARGKLLGDVFHIINEQSRVAVENPVDKVLREEQTVGLANHTVLVSRDGSERSIDDSAAPIRDAAGELYGVVLVFRDITERRNTERMLAERLRLLKLGAEVGSALTGTEGIREILQTCTESMVENLNAAFARIWVLNEQDNVLELHASAGLYTHLNGDHARVPVGKFKIGKIADERKPHFTNSVIGDPRVPEQDWAKREGLVSFAGYPLMVADRVIGVMAMFARHPLSDVTLEAMESVADEIALGIQHRTTVTDLKEAFDYTESIVEGLIEPLVVLDRDLRVDSVNIAFCEMFRVVPDDTEGELLYELGNGQWNVPALRMLLEDVLPKDSEVVNFEVEHRFPEIGHRIMRLNAREIYQPLIKEKLILLTINDVTDRELANRSVRESQELLKTTLASIGDAVITTDVDGRVTTLNGVAESLTGWSNEDAAGVALTDVFRIVNETSRQPVENPALRALAEGQIVGLANHTILIARDGTEVPIDDSAAPIRDDKGDIRGAVLIFRDITDRKQAEVELRTSRERLELAMEAAGLGHWELNLATREATRTLLHDQIFGYQSQLPEWTYERFLEHVHPDDRAIVTATFREALASRTLWEIECRIRRADGIQRWIWSRAMPLSASSTDNQDDRLVGIVRDITERKQSEEALRQSEARFTQLADAIPQLAWMARADGQIDWYNTRWYEYTGTTFEQMRGWGWKSVHDPNVLPEVMGKWQNSLETGDPFDMVFPLRGADGTFRPFLTRIMPFRNDDGHVVRWFGTNTDISEQSRTEEELRRVAAQLSEADRRKNEFLATLAHELRNPLAPIRTGLEALKMLEDDREARESVRKTMERQTEQMVHLIDDLLDVSRITRGRLQLRMDRIELADVVQSAVEATSPLVEEARHQLTINLPADPIILDADATRLAQVFSNLLNNAAKYTPQEGHIELSVDQQDGEVLVSVSDDGLGIPADMHESIFEMFGQIDRSDEETYTGLGIGLTLVKSLVEMHGGRIDVESEGANRGSRFMVRLPVAQEVSTHTAAPDDSLDSESEEKHHILIVDDNQDAAKMLSMIVALMGHDVSIAHDGLEAVSQAEAIQPDIIIMDIGMPRLNGYEAARRIREQSWGRSIILIALTGWGQDNDKRKTKAAGFDAHLVKPAEPAEVQKLIKDLPSKKQVLSGDQDNR